MNTIVMNGQSSRDMLRKKRQRHSWWFAALLIPLILFSNGQIPSDSFAEEMMDHLGLAFIIFCVLGRSYCSMFIGGIKNERVVRDAPFSVVRNPLYVCSFLGIVGVGLESDRLSILLILVIAFILYYRHVVRGEETYLLHKFGDTYSAYLKEVPRWLPKWSLWQESEQVAVRPYFIRQTMMDAAVFFIAIPAFEMLEYMQHHHLLPIYLTLP